MIRGGCNFDKIRQKVVDLRQRTESTRVDFAQIKVQAKVKIEIHQMLIASV